MLRAAVIGQVVIDEIVAPGAALTEPSVDRVRVGGKGFNLAVALARLGCNAEIVSAVGGDPSGELATQRLQEEGVGVRYLRHCSLSRDSPVKTPRVRLTEGRFGEREFDLDVDRKIFACYESALQGVATASSFDVVVFTLEFPKQLMRSLAACVRTLKRNRGCLIVGNPAPRPKPAHGSERTIAPFEVLRLADLLTPNRFEAAFLIEEDPASRPAAEVAKRINEIYGSAECYVTFGAEGWSWSQGQSLPTGDVGTLPPVEVIDKVGAGDVFTAAVGMARLRDVPPADAALVGGVAARLAVARTGGAESFPYVAELLDELRSLGYESAAAQTADLLTSAVE